MLKALAWKEWRQQRPLILAGLGIAAVLPLFMMAGMMATTANRNFNNIIDIMWLALLFFVWPLIAAATGATTFGADMADDSLRFLLSRPVSKARVWSIKMAVGIAAFLAVVAGSILIVVSYTFAFSPSRATLQRSVQAFEAGLDPRALGLLIACALLLFGCSVYCSMFLRRPMVAALAGAVAAVGMSFVVGLIWTLVLPRFPFGPIAFLGIGVAVGLPLGAVGVFAAAFWAFWRGDILGASGGVKVLTPLVLVGLVVMLIGAVPVVYGGLSRVSDLATSASTEILVADAAVVFTEPTASGLTTRIVRADLDGSGTQVVVPTHGALPAVSPDGEWVAYVSFGSYLGILSSRPQLRAVRIDGSDDHVISSSPVTWEWGFAEETLTIAPDNDTVAYYAGASGPSTPGGLWLTSISEGVSRYVDLDAPRARMLGWTEERSELLYSVIRNRRTPDAHTEIHALDPDSGAERIVRDLEGGQNIYRTGGGYYSLQNGRAWTWLPLWLATDDGSVMALLDTRDGELIELSSSPCGYWGFSRDGGRFFYGHCSGSLREGDQVTALRVLDLESRTDEPFATIQGYLSSGNGRELLPSPKGDRVVLYARRERNGTRGTWVVPRVGEPREVIGGGIPVAWLNDRDVLVRWRRARLQLLVVDSETGERTNIYEPR